MVLQSSSAAVRIFLIALLSIVSFLVVAYAEDCPQCYFNEARPNTTGNGIAADGRPKLTVKIDSSWNVDNAGNPQGSTNSNIWNGVTGCANCVPPDGAAGMWNSAQGSGGQGINFHIELNQATQNPNILIVRDNTLSSSTCAYINLDPPGGPYVMHLPGSMAGNDLWRVVESMAHEIGHAIGLADIPDETAKTECGYSDIMAPAANGCFSQVGKSVTARDVDQSRKGMDNNVRATCESQLNNQLKIDELAASPTPTPTPPPSCPDNCPNPQQYAPATCFGPVDWCQYPDTGCESGLQENGRCCCSWNTPIIIDTLGDGFSLTEPENGVVFDITGLGAPEQISWTEINSDDAFLALDRNGNGVIDNGSELFGNTAPQPQPAPGIARNGFFALAEFDKPANGGNGDGLIDQQDAVYGTLLLWRDLNHNGICEPIELSRLVDAKVDAISLDFKESKHRDKWGNGFRYRSRVTGNNIGRWAYDVVLQIPVRN